MRLLRAAAVAGALTISSAGCGSNNAAPNTVSVDPKLIARGTVETLETAWLVSAKACVAVAQVNGDEALLAKCEAILSPARDSLIAAGYAVDDWTASNQVDFPCLIGDVAMALRGIGGVLGAAGVQLPVAVEDALAMSAIFAPQCRKTRSGGDAGVGQ